MSAPAKTPAAVAYEPPENPVDQYVLLHPVTAYGTTYEALSLRRLTAADMEVTDGLGKHAGAVRLIHLSSNARLAVVRKLDAEDYDNLSGIVAGFFGSGPPTGGEPSPDSD